MVFARRSGVREKLVDVPAVLFVDDDEELLESLRVVLRNEPYSIFTASSVVRARRLLLEERIDVIVCDDRLPTQNGTAFLAELKAEAHPAVRIVLSGGGVMTAQRAINDAAVFRFLAKPCSSKMVAEAVRQAVAFSAEHAKSLVDGTYRMITARAGTE